MKIHAPDITGSLNTLVGGNISGSSTSTGSFGHIIKGGVNWDTAVSSSAATAGFGGGGGTITALNNATENELVTIGSTTTELDAEFGLTYDGQDLSINGDDTDKKTLQFRNTTDDSKWQWSNRQGEQGSGFNMYHYNGSSWNTILTIDTSSYDWNFPLANMKISGSATSTGSFGALYLEGTNNVNVLSNILLPSDKSLRIGGSTVVALDSNTVKLNQGGFSGGVQVYAGGLEVRSGNISGSATSTGSFGQVRSNIVGQRPTVTQNSDFTASMAYAGHYNIVGGELTCSILAEATASVFVGTEYEFFQTSSVGTMLFQSASLVNVYSKDGAMALTGQYSGATLKKVATNTWHLVGDIG